MSAVLRIPASTSNVREVAALRVRVAEAEATLHAIRSGTVDAVVIAGKLGPRVFTLEGAEHAYRVLIESMNEGAVTLSGNTILYANECFARMLKYPLEQVTGSSPLRRFLSAEDDAALRPLLKRARKSGSKIQVGLRVSDDSIMPVQISIRPLARNGFKRPTVGMVVTDMTEARRSESALRSLTRRLVQAQETERGRVALELHDGITQLLCAILVRSQALVDALSSKDRGPKSDALNLRGMIAGAADEVQRISRNLHPSVLDELGLVACLRSTSKAFGARTGIVVEAALVPMPTRLPAETELTLYRILQEALTNVEKHARAHRVSVSLTQELALVRLSIRDDGRGFDPDHRAGRRKQTSGVGLLGMRERATYVGGTLKVSSIPRGGTEIEVRVPAAERTGKGRRKTPLTPGRAGSERS